MPRSLFALLAAALTTACIGTTDPLQKIDYGLINIVTTPNAGGTAYTTAPSGLFVRGNFNLPSTAARDRCQVLSYVPQGTVTGLEYVDAGAEIAFSLSGTNTTLVKKTDGSVTSYVLPTVGSSITFTPGDTAFLTIPGATGGFPSSNIAVRTAEPFTFGAVSIGTIGDDISLTWSAAPHPNSVMVVSLRYALAPATGQNQQVYCELIDDGAFTISGDITGDWSSVTTKNRVVAATRYRAAVKQVGSDILHAASVFNVTPTVQ